MDQLDIINDVAVHVAGDGVLALLSVGFRWLQNSAVHIYDCIARWWGGDQARDRVWDAYKSARDAIMRQETNNDMRLILIQDIRSEFRLRYRAYADLWN